MPSSTVSSASIASRPTFRDVAQRPSSGTGRQGYRVIWVFRKTEYFCARDLTGHGDGRSSGKSPACEKRRGCPAQGRARRRKKALGFPDAPTPPQPAVCLLYTSDAADDLL